jgi:hypothetical protein
VAAMRHPNIVQIFDYEAAEEANYMVMEFIDGGTLQGRISALAKEGKRMPVGEILAILRQVAAALDYAHGRGILHRDVKPSNILLDSTGTAFLTDFGIARILSGSQMTATGVMIGTPTYMSPEQGTGEELTAASDLYSLGIIAYELLSGKVPFSSDTTPLAVIHKHVSQPPPGLRTLRESLPAAAEQAVLKALAKKPKERHRSAEEFIRALEKALPGEAIRALDKGEARGAIPVSKQPTLVMDEDAASSRAHLPTEVMEFTPAENAPWPTPETQEVPEPVRSEPAVVDKAAPAVTSPHKEIRETKKPERKTRVPAAALFGRLRPKIEAAMASIRGLLQTRRGQIAVIGVAAVIVLAVGGWLLSGGFASMTCGSVESCLDQAFAARGRGDLAGYVSLMRAAADRVPGDQHPPHAGIWCDIGDAEQELGRIDSARESFTRCIEWTEGIPDLNPERMRAEEALQGLQ